MNEFAIAYGDRFTRPVASISPALLAQPSPQWPLGQAIQEGLAHRNSDRLNGLATRP